MIRSLRIANLLWILVAYAPPLAAQTSVGSLRLSWAGCDQLQTHTSLSGGSIAQLVISQVGTDIPNVGFEMALDIGPTVPDAWRFDDLGCQTSSQIRTRATPFSKSCPAMSGANRNETVFFPAPPSTINAWMKFICIYDTVFPNPQTRYTWWVIDFDHSYTVAGTDDDPNTCDGGDEPICLSLSTEPTLRPHLLGADIVYYYPVPENEAVKWGSSVLLCGDTVPTRLSTWGRVKALSR